MFTQYSCNMLAEEVKQVVISVRDYHVRREISPVPWELTKESRIDLVKMAEHHAKHQLLNGLEQFVKVNINQERNFVEAKIWMPYVKDEVVRTLEETEKRLQSHLDDRNRTIRHLQERVKYLELPWWKKLALWIKEMIRGR